MGRLEEEAKKRAKKRNLQKAILSTLYGAGMISIAMLAPNVIGAFGKLGLLKKNRNYAVQRSLDGLLAKRLIVFEKTPEGRFIKLTPQGEAELHRMYKGGILPKPPSWDEKWRIVIYDLKEYKKPIREKLRATLAGFGFIKLQDSVWVYPYDCEDLITLVKADFKVGKEILYLITDKLENDGPLRTMFGIS